MKAGLFLLPLLLCGCRSPEPESALVRQVTALEARIAALEGEVADLKAGPPVTGAADAGDVTARAAAQNCAIAVSRTLELFRQSSLGKRYPGPAQITLPDACEGQRVGWNTLEAQRYAFTVSGGDGVVLARQSGP